MSGPDCWLALLAEEPTDAWACAGVRDLDGTPRGWLAAWRGERPEIRPHPPGAADPAALDPRGEPAWASLLLIDPERDVLFDDGAVQEARRRVLAERPWAAVTTLSRDASRFGGSLLAARGPGARRRLAEDPFALIGRPLRLAVGPGLVGVSPPLPAPVIERAGGLPWPARPRTVMETNHS